MSKTFYIASAGTPEQRERVRKLAIRLQTLYGWKWHGNWDWTATYGAAKDSDIPLHSLSYRAINDRIGARDCDVFIFWEIPDPVSKGANREYGVRWGAEKDIYHLCETEIHLFDTVNNVYTVYNEQDLIFILEDREL